MEMISDTNQSIKLWKEKRYSEISSGSFVFKNDILIAKITPSFENGKQAILDKLPLDYGYATTEIWALHPKNENVITQYLYYYLKVDPLRVNMAGKMEGSTGRQRLPKHVLEILSIPLPPLLFSKKLLPFFPLLMLKSKLREQEESSR
jgi:type I restriction enzyme S subunit